MPCPVADSCPALRANTEGRERLLEFFTSKSTTTTRLAYLNATSRFAEWCETHGPHQLADVHAFHVAAFRILFDWLVTRHNME